MASNPIRLSTADLDDGGEPWSPIVKGDGMAPKP
jgi:hypothetical protein